MSALDELRKKPWGQMTKLEYCIAWHGAKKSEMEQAAAELVAKDARIAELENIIKIIDKTVHNEEGAMKCLCEIYEAVLKLSDKGR